VVTIYVLHRLWSWFPAAGITLGKHVFVKNLGDQTTIDHELIHVRQQAEEGVWFWVAYLFLLPFGWNPWRTFWEAEAYAVNARAGQPIDGDGGLAATLAGVHYGWPCRRATAARLIREAASRAGAAMNEGAK
jgi:hypothetical protein